MPAESARIGREENKGGNFHVHHFNSRTRISSSHNIVGWYNRFEIVVFNLRQPESGWWHAAPHLNWSQGSAMHVDSVHEIKALSIQGKESRPWRYSSVAVDMASKIRCF